jgi:hypothetical protein
LGCIFDGFTGVTADVLLLYPGESLKEQMGMWTMRHPERHVHTPLSCSPPELCALLRHAAVVIDATEQPGMAREAFLLAVGRLGANAVVMYTERMHDDALELFVRERGSLFILGPLLAEQWEEYFERLLRRKVAVPTVPVLLGQGSGLPTCPSAPGIVFNAS